MLSRSWGKALLIAAMLLAALVASAGWYLVQNSMSVARGFEVNDPKARPRVLIATQGSAFKDAVVTGVVDGLGQRGAYVKVIDISSLGGVHEKDWNAIVILHTWQMGQPPVQVKEFVHGAREPYKLVALATSGRGDFKLDGVDAISSASRMAEVPARVAEVMTRVNSILQGARP
jgi:hypothetical protein